MAVLVIFYLAAWRFGLYKRRLERGSFHELKALLGIMLTAAIVVGIPAFLAAGFIGVPRSTMPIAVTILVGLRYIRRLRQELAVAPDDSMQRTLVYGAGYLDRRQRSRH